MNCKNIFILILYLLLIPSLCLAFDKTFFPIGIYNVTLDECPLLKELAFNLIIGGVEDTDFIRIKNNSLRTLSGYQIQDEIKDSAYIIKNKNNPVIAAWYMQDEPDLNRIPVEKISKLYNCIKDNDELHPAFLVVYNPQKYKTYFPYCDIMAVDPYPIMTLSDKQNRIENVYYFTKYAKSLFPDKPVWAIIQAFAGLPYWQKPPTPKEFRNMVYQAIIAGANGILYYAYRANEPFKMNSGKEHWYLPDDTGLFKEVKKINYELKQIIPIIQNEIDNNMTQKIIINTPEKIFYRIIGNFDKTYIFLANANRTNSQLTIKIKDTSEPNKIILKEHFSKKILFSGTDYSLKLSPLETKIIEY